jgi:hypothetical protein
LLVQMQKLCAVSIPIVIEKNSVVIMLSSINIFNFIIS